jgi:hypothetical protein
VGLAYNTHPLPQVVLTRYTNFLLLFAEIRKLFLA